MTIHVELRDRSGRAVTGLPDPSGGTFDAAGDLDRFLDQPPYCEASGGLPVIASIDPFGDTTLHSGLMGQLIADCVRALAVANDGAEERGLLRPRVLAEECSKDPDSVLLWAGD